MLVMAGISASVISVNAASFAAGDLLLGFQASSGTGSTTNVIADLVTAVSFRDAASNISNVMDLGSILSSTYGSNWATRSDLSWGAVANRQPPTLFNNTVDGDPRGTNYVTIAQSTTHLGAQHSFTPTESGSTSAAGVSNTIQALGDNYGTVNSGTQGGYITIDSRYGNTWSNEIIANQNFMLSFPIQATGNIASSGLDLYRIIGFNTYNASPTGPQYHGAWYGTFGINSSGVVSSNNTVDATLAAAPEPGRALLAAFGLGGLLLRRRRQLMP